MPTIEYVLIDGTSRNVKAPIGISVMQAAVQNNVPGIVAECLGSLACATCHVYVESGDEGTRPISEAEANMLDCTASERRPNSRLSCQLMLASEGDHFVVRVPESQII